MIDNIAFRMFTDGHGESNVGDEKMVYFDFFEIDKYIKEDLNELVVSLPGGNEGNPPLMLSFGDKDRNNKKVYTGDILVTEGSKKIGQGFLFGFWGKSRTFLFHPVKIKGNQYIYDTSKEILHILEEINLYEVIGNIYEDFFKKDMFAF